MTLLTSKEEERRGWREIERGRGDGMERDGIILGRGEDCRRMVGVGVGGRERAGIGLRMDGEG